MPPYHEKPGLVLGSRHSLWVCYGQFLSLCCHFTLPIRDSQSDYWKLQTNHPHFFIEGLAATDGDLAVFEISKKLNLLKEINMGASIYGAPVVVGQSILIPTCRYVFCVEGGE